MPSLTLMTALTLNASGFNNGIDLAIKDTEDFKKAIGAASVQTIKAFKDISEMGVGEMRKNLRELKNISFAGKTVEEIGAINKQIGMLEDQMGDLKAVQKSMGTELGSALASGLQTISAMGEIGVGVATMFGATEEQAKKYQQTMISLIGVTQAAGVIEDALSTGQLKNLALRIQSEAAIVAETAAKYANAAASRLMGTAIALNPMMLAVTAAAALVVGIVALTGAFQDNRGAIDGTNESLKTTIELQLQAQKGALDLAAKNQLALLQIEKDSGKITAKDFDRKKNALEKESALRAVEKSEKQAMADFDKALKEEEAKTYAMTVTDYAAWEAKKKEILVDFGIQKGEIIKQEYLQNKIVELGIDPIKRQAGAVREVKDAWVEAYEKTLELQQYDVPIPIDYYTRVQSDGEVPDNADYSVSVDTEDMTVVLDDYASRWADAIADFKVKFSTMIEGMAMDMSTLIGTSFANMFDSSTSNNEKWKSFGSGVLSSVANFMEQIGKQLIVMGGLAEIIQAAIATVFTNPASPVALIIAGIGFSVGGAVLNSIAAKGFANGGIVPGVSFSGDKINARLNSGEMVLNASQQANLFAIANGGGGGGGGNVRFEIEGTKLIGVLANQAKKNNNTR